MKTSPSGWVRAAQNFLDRALTEPLPPEVLSKLTEANRLLTEAATLYDQITYGEP